MSLEDVGLGGVPGWTEPWWLGPQLRMTVSGRLGLAEPTGVDEGGQGPAEVADCYARQVDELAALVESALREEDDGHRALVELVRVRHQRRVTSLRVLAESLGEAYAAFDELAHRLRVSASTTTAAGVTTDTAAAAPARAVSSLVGGGS